MCEVVCVWGGGLSGRWRWLAMMLEFLHLKDAKCPECGVQNELFKSEQASSCVCVCLSFPVSE